MPACTACGRAAATGEQRCALCRWVAAGGAVLGSAAGLTVVPPVAPSAVPRQARRTTSPRPDHGAGTVPPDRHLELVCAVELCGPTPTVKARVDFVHALLADLGARFGNARFGVVGYFDHSPQLPPGGRRGLVVDGDGLGSAADAVKKLEDWEPRPQVRHDAAAMEDALEKLAELSWARTPATTDAVLVLVGRRRPCMGPEEVPPPHGARIAVCTRGVSWRRERDKLHGRAVRLVAVRDPAQDGPSADAMTPAVKASADSAWLALAPEAQLRRIPGDGVRVRTTRGAETTMTAMLFPEQHGAAAGRSGGYGSAS